MMHDRGTNIRVTNNSWGGGPLSQAIHDAIAAQQSRDMLFIASAGNDGSNTDIFPTYPADIDLDNIISVAATDNKDKLASFSNWGPASVDLAAPGVNVLSTAFHGGGYAYLSGTSMAAPHVTGAIALVLSVAPTATYQQLRSALVNSVDVLPTLNGSLTTFAR